MHCTLCAKIDRFGSEHNDHFDMSNHVGRAHDGQRERTSRAFVRMFYGSPSSSLWEDASGVTHMIPRGGLLGTSALETIQEDLNDHEFLFAFLDDIHIATTFHRVGDVYKPLD